MKRSVQHLLLATALAIALISLWPAEALKLWDMAWVYFMVVMFWFLCPNVNWLGGGCGEISAWFVVTRLTTIAALALAWYLGWDWWKYYRRLVKAAANKGDSNV